MGAPGRECGDQDAHWSKTQEAMVGVVVVVRARVVGTRRKVRKSSRDSTPSLSQSIAINSVRCARASASEIPHQSRIAPNPTAPVATAAAAAAAAPVAVMPKDEKLGVILLNLGGPEKPEDVEGFLYNLFNDPDIIRLPEPLRPLQSFLAQQISSGRAPKSRAAYNAIGGGSPLLRITTEQSAALRDTLRARGYANASTYVAMRYWHPFTDEALEQVRKDVVTRLVVLPLYPQYSISTSGSSLRAMDMIMRRDRAAWSPLKIDHTVVPQWYERPGYLRAMAKGIRAEVAKAGPGSKKVMFSAHGVPESYIAAGDPYQRQMKDCCEKIMAEVGPEVEWTLCYQSRVGPVTWLKPYTDEVIQELGAEGLENLIVVPVSFVSEHIETLEEIDIEYRELALESGVKNFLRVPALDSDPDFIADLASAVVEATERPSLRVSEALALTQGTDEEDPEVNWKFGFTRGAEALNGRLAMLAIGAFGVLKFANIGQLSEAMKLVPFLK
mmetsp:Transcript_19238/g.51056  ORF Transcript_19238/g.51056 Transcript_19238/m.51056 type:complete len:499 (+) Transcript_19238:305-1801(+)